MSDGVKVIKQAGVLADWLGDPDNEGKLVETTLSANDRVIARVTDGIYRQPASALRELISNAWDADAANVTILTDAPRFSRIYVRDDGAGMSHEMLARLLKNIGGSAKRLEEGKDLGVTSAEDADRTPKGRLLIGKIGIGLFSVSQLARRFQIITKVAGSDYRLVADVALRAYSDNPEADASAEDSDEFLAGKVLIKREKASRKSAHGTDIILLDLKPPVRDLLRSSARWRAIAEKKAATDLDEILNNRVEEPAYHSGYIERPSKSTDKPDVLSVEAKLPWDEEDAPDQRMSKLVDAVEKEFSRNQRPDLSKTLDAYLEMIWTLGQSAPVGYVDSHPFDLKGNGRLKLFWITDARGKGEELKLKRGQSVREAVREHAPGHPDLMSGADEGPPFSVTIDGVELRRPIRFKYQRTEKRGLDHAYLFVGKFEPDLEKVSPSQRGGELSLEAYLFWTGRVVPKENNGVLVRIRGASGALFDPTFFQYQVSELTRLKQIISELYVHQGLDAALNIDRESFNFAHPHFGLVTQWLHAAIKQLTNRLKDDAARLRKARRERDASEGRENVHAVASATWEARRGSAEIPDVVIADDEAGARSARNEGSIAIVRAAVPKLAQTKAADRTTLEAQTTALIQVLEAYGLLEDRSYDEQQQLVEAILEIFAGPAG